MWYNSPVNKEGPMYHIKNDKRCQRSAQAISEALNELLTRKSFMDITVTDIQRTAGIGRSTFYRLFDTIDDVVTYIVDKEFQEVVKGYAVLDAREFTVACLKGIIDKDDALMRFLSSGRSELITASLRKNLHEVVMQTDPSAEYEVQYRFAVFASACISVIRVWDENGRRESIEELADYIFKNLRLIRP